MGERKIKKTRILIIDDEPMVRSLLANWLRTSGFEPLEASDGPGGLALALQETPEAVLLDLSLPGMDGFEVCRSLRQDSRTATTAILLITGYDDVESRVAGFGAGADDYLTKPFEATELLARLRSHLDLASARREVAQLQGALATIRMISHEFNNPLQVVLGAVDLLDGQESCQPELAAEAVQMLREATDRLGDLASRLVAISEPVYKTTPIGTMLDIEASR